MDGGRLDAQTACPVKFQLDWFFRQRDLRDDSLFS
jgi:hypothetical protein